VARRIRGQERALRRVPIQSSPRRLPALSSTDVLVIGAGPAALVIAAELAERGLVVEALAPHAPDTPWSNTYGIWVDELSALGLEGLLSHRWSDTVSHFGPGGAGGDGSIQHGRAYGLFDKALLQGQLLRRSQAAGVRWHRGRASGIRHEADRSLLQTDGSQALSARLVIDASGHQAALVQRPEDGPLAGQAAYGIVGRFTAAPITPGQFVFMDYRCDHLSPRERRHEPPTFLYAMDLGEGVFFVEETSLALAPPVPFPLLQQRLQRRLQQRGVAVQEVIHEEFCLFPMNPCLPQLDQRLLAFGGAASMVHPASGYLVGGLLRRAPALAAAIAAGLQQGLRGAALAEQAWQGLWPSSLRWRHAFFRFGLEKLMRFEEDRLRHHFASFFSLAPEQWFGFLTNTLEPPQLLAAMLQLFGQAPWDVRLGLMGLQGRELILLTRLLLPG